MSGSASGVSSIRRPDAGRRAPRVRIAGPAAAHLLRAAIAFALAGAFAASAEAQAPALTWATGAGGREYLASISAAGATYGFSETEIIHFVLFDAEFALHHPQVPPPAAPFYNEAHFLVPGGQCNPVRNGNTLSFSNAQYGVTASLSFVPQGERISCVISATSSSPRYALAEIWGPTLRLQAKAPAAQMYSLTPAIGGGVSCPSYSTEQNTDGYLGAVPPSTTAPAWGGLNLGVPTGQIPMPGGFQMVACWHGVERDVFMLTFDDEVGFDKRIRILNDGLTTDTIIVPTHVPLGTRFPGNTFVQRYGMFLEVFLGPARAGSAAPDVDRRLGVYDAVEKYRSWAAASSRPWNSRGPWHAVTDGSFSPAIAETDLYVGHLSSRVQTNVAPGWAADLTVRSSEMRSLKSFLGFTTAIDTWWTWYRPPAGFLELQPEFFPEQDTYREAMTAAKDAGVKVALYEWPSGFDLDLDEYKSAEGSPARWAPSRFQLVSGTSPCGPYEPILEVDVRPLLALDHLGLPLVAPGLQWSFLDLRSVGAAVVVDNILRQHFELLSVKPNGWYFDYFGGGGPILSHGFVDPSVGVLCPGCAPGNDGKWTPGKLAASHVARKSITDCDPEGFVSTELPDELLIPAFDVFHVYPSLRTPSPYGPGTLYRGGGYWLFGNIHGEHVRTAAAAELFAEFLDPATSVATDGFARSMEVAAAFHATGLISYQSHWDGDWVALAAAHLAAGDPTAYGPAIVLQAMKSIHDRRAAYRPFVRGRRLRALPGSWEADFFASGLDLRAWLAAHVYDGIAGGPGFHLSSVWRAPDGTVGILANTLLAPAAMAIEFEAARYGFTATEQLILEKWSGTAWVPANLSAPATPGGGPAPSPCFVGGLRAVAALAAGEFAVFRVRPCAAPGCGCPP
jgi:hypothetical protein